MHVPAGGRATATDLYPVCPSSGLLLRSTALLLHLSPQALAGPKEKCVKTVNTLRYQFSKINILRKIQSFLMRIRIEKGTFWRYIVTPEIYISYASCQATQLKVLGNAYLPNLFWHSTNYFYNLSLGVSYGRHVRLSPLLQDTTVSGTELKVHKTKLTF